jgi:hypothetical protein
MDMAKRLLDLGPASPPGRHQGATAAGSGHSAPPVFQATAAELGVKVEIEQIDPPATATRLRPASSDGPVRWWLAEPIRTSIRHPAALDRSMPIQRLQQLKMDELTSPSARAQR